MKNVVICVLAVTILNFKVKIEVILMETHETSIYQLLMMQKPEIEQ